MALIRGFTHCFRVIHVDIFIEGFVLRSGKIFNCVGSAENQNNISIKMIEIYFHQGD